MTETELELEILRRYTAHHESAGDDARKCALELDMREVISSITGSSPSDRTVMRWHTRLAPPASYRTGVLRPCSDTTVNNSGHKYHARAFYEPGKSPAWDRIVELEPHLPPSSPADREYALKHPVRYPAQRGGAWEQRKAQSGSR